MIAEFKIQAAPVWVVYKEKSRFIRVLDTIEQHGVDRCTANELDHGKKPVFEDKASPDVWNYETGNNQRFITLDADIQHWMFRCMVEVYQGYKFDTEADYRAWHKANKGSQLANWFTSILRSNGSHTNKSGFGEMFENIPSAANYIRDEDLQNGPPKLWHLVTGRWVGELATDDIRSFYGTPCKGVKVINISKRDYRKYHPFDTPEYFDQPLLTGRDMVKDKEGVRIVGHWRSPYGQFDGKAVFPVCAPFDDIAWIPAKYLIQDNSKPGRKFG